MSNVSKSNSNVVIHLLFTSIITEKRRKVHAGTKDLKNRDRVSIFLTTLRSLATLPITSCDFYIELDPTTEWARDIIKKEISKMIYR